MSDLRRAVEAETDAFAPDRVPHFDTVVARKRRRDRLARTGGALAIAGLAAPAVVLVPLGWGGGDDVLPTADQPAVPSAVDGDAETYRYDLAFADDAVYDTHIEAASACLDAAEPASRSHIGALGGPPVSFGTVIGTDRADALRACVAGLDGVQLTITPEGKPAAGMAERSLAALRPLPESRDLRDLTGGSRQEGVLRGDRASECLWLETDGGEQVPLAVYVGEGIYVDFSVSPFEITDGRGGYSVAEGTPVRLTGGYQPDVTAVQGCPVPGPPFVGTFLVESGFESEPVQDGFRNTGAGYTEQIGDGPSRMVGSFENVGEAARTATFVVELKEEDGSVVWTGRATVEDIEKGETVLARYESAEPLPDGSQYVLWRVEDVVRTSAD